MPRLIWLVTGIAWAATSAILFADPQYWDPVTVLDWTAVWAYTAAWLLFAPSIFLIGRRSSSRLVRVLAAICAVSAIVTGCATALEDGFGVEGAGGWYVIGLLATALYLVPLALMLRRAGDARLAGLCAVLLVGLLLFAAGGGFIILAALGALAIAPDRFVSAGTADDEAPTLTG